MPGCAGSAWAAVSCISGQQSCESAFLLQRMWNGVRPATAALGGCGPLLCPSVVLRPTLFTSRAMYPVGTQAGHSGTHEPGALIRAHSTNCTCTLARSRMDILLHCFLRACAERLQRRSFNIIRQLHHHRAVIPVKGRSCGSLTLQVRPSSLFVSHRRLAPSPTIPSVFGAALVYRRVDPVSCRPPWHPPTHAAACCAPQGVASLALAPVIDAFLSDAERTCRPLRTDCPARQNVQLRSRRPCIVRNATDDIQSARLYGCIWQHLHHINPRFGTCQHGVLMAERWGVCAASIRRKADSSTTGTQLALNFGPVQHSA